MKNMTIGPDFLKFNSALLNNVIFKVNLRDFIENTKIKLNFNDTQLNWEFLKYEIRKFIVSYPKVIAKRRKSQTIQIRKYAEIRPASI